jgi:hypothetical protein
MKKFRKKFRSWLWPSLRKFDQVKLEISKLRSDIQSETQRAHLNATVFRSPEVEAFYRDLFGRIKIKAVTGHSKKRVGSESDGGYVMIDNLASIDCCYSLGIFNEVSWDLEMANRGIPVLQYDDSVKGPPSPHEKFTFYRERIVDATAPGANQETLEGIITKHRHQGKKLILKMDIEGSEWAVLDATSAESLAQFDQILVEFHDFSRLIEHPFRERAKRVLDKLNLHHTPIHVHANNCSRIYNLPNFYFSNILELSYVKTVDYSLVNSEEIFPGPYDRPNVPDLPEVYLGKFKFD